MVGLDRPGEPDVPTLIVLHGLGSNADDLMGLANEIGYRGRVISIQAPIAYGPGFAWFPIGFADGALEIGAEAVSSAVDALAVEIGRREIDPANAIIAGFSQGATMAIHTADRMGGYRGVVGLSGFVIPPLLFDLPWTSGPVLLQHGEYDDVVPAAAMGDIRGHLEAKGAVVTARTYPMGHSVSLASMEDLTSWLDLPE